MNKIKRIKIIGLLSIGILTFQIAFSQENYMPGYVIETNADTLFGFIDYRNWAKNPHEIKFKANIESNPTSLSPTDITEFKVGGEIYVSAVINTEVSPTNTSRLTYYNQINIKPVTAFLQTLIKGEKGLYYYKSPEGKENFYIKQPSGFDLLIYKRYLTQHDSKRIKTENNKYLGQLTLYLNDCNTINSKIENTPYERNSLINLFQYYYKCSSSHISFQSEKDKIHTEIGVLAGASLTSLKLRSQFFNYLTQAGYKPSINFSTGIYFDHILPRNRNKWSINNELLISTYKVSGKYEEYVNENNYSVTTTELGYMYLKLNSFLRFKYPIGSMFIFFNGGVTNGFALYETNHKTRETKFYATNRVDKGLALNDTRKYEQGFVLGSGLKYDRFSFEIRYEKGNGMSEYTTLSSATNRLYLLLGYKF